MGVAEAQQASGVARPVDSAQKWGPVERQRLAFVARGFESLLLYQLLRALQQPLLSTSDAEQSGLGFGTGGWTELALLPFAEFLASSGSGIGLARWLYRQWADQELPMRSTVSPPDPERGMQARQTGAELQQGPPGRQIRTALQPYWGWIEEAADAAGLSPALVAAVVWAESAGNPRAVSRAGAQGLMQLMPQTARMLGVADPFEPRQNLMAGSRYLGQLLERFGDLRHALAAYNAGPGRVQHYGGIPPFAETQSYVRRVLELYRHLEAARVVPAQL